MLVVIFIAVFLKEALGLAMNEIEPKFHSGNLDVFDMDTTADIRVDFICMGNQYCNQLTLNFTFAFEDTDIAMVTDNKTILLAENSLKELNQTSQEFQVTNITVPVRAEFLGKTRLSVTLYDKDQEKRWYHRVNVRRVETLLDRLFQGCLALILIITQMTFGCELDLSVMKNYIKKPIGVLLGMSLQYGILPSAAFGLGYLLDLEKELAFGLLVIGCSPGGGGSNIITSIIDGDINLSIMMTFASNIVALAMMPLWIYTLGSRILGEPASIPFVALFLLLIFLLVVPTGVGVLIKRKKPSAAEKIVKYLRPVTLLVLLLLVAVGIYVNLYVVTLLSQAAWQLIIACALLPLVAIAICAVITALLRQPGKQIKTICVEVAVQNSAVPILVIKAAMDQPDADLSSVPSMLVAISVNTYMATAMITHVVYKKFCKKKQLQKDDTKPVGNGDTAKYNEGYNEYNAVGGYHSNGPSTTSDNVPTENSLTYL